MAQQEQERAIFARFFSPDSALPPGVATPPTETTIFVRFFADATSTPQNQPPATPATAEPAQPDVSAETADSAVSSVPATATAAEPALPDTPSTDESSDQGFFTRVKLGLSRTRNSFTKGMANILIGHKEIDDELIEDIETQLLVADVGIEATNRIMAALTERVSRRELYDADALYTALQQELSAVLSEHSQPLVIDTARKPYVMLMIGVNGVGKTTTIGKLAKRLQKEGKTVMLAAGDTFRAAAVEQLQVWGGRNNIPVIAQHTGADSASVIYDAMQAAQARNVDVLIADTAGRLHNKSNLMEELKKVKRVLSKLDATAPHEVMLVLDAGTGQNALNQCQQFSDTIGVTGITLTKLDGTAKGGIVFSIAAKTRIPIRFIGVGEQIDDLRPFNADEFVEALFASDD